MHERVCEKLGLSMVETAGGGLDKIRSGLVGVGRLILC